jgi:dTDP-glucose pyrophosphorylase
MIVGPRSDGTPAPIMPRTGEYLSSAAPGAAPAPTIPLVGVLLAAGKGSRIRPFSDTLPKPLLPVLDRPLLVWQIEAMRSLGITEITIVIGHLGHRIVQTLGDGSALGVRLAYVEQDRTLGIAHAVGQLEPTIQRPFLLFLGDIFFETRELGSLIQAFARQDVHGVLAVKREPSPEAIRRNFTVEVDHNGFVRRVIEKPRHPKTDIKGCGLYLFDPAIFDAIRRTPRTALRDEYELTDAIQIFIDYGYGVVAADVVENDLNLSTPKDLLDLNLHVLAKSGQGSMVGPGAQIGTDVQLVESIIGAGARIAAGTRLERCLVLPGESAGPGHHQRRIFASGAAVDC